VNGRETGLIVKRTGSRAEMYIYCDIGDMWGGECVTASDFAKALAELDRVTQIDLFISSAGGLIHDGMAIYSLLVKHPATVRVDIDGLAASTASWVAMAGDTIRMSENAMLMIHEPWSGVFGNSTEMRKEADVLDRLRDTIANTYAARTGLSRANLVAMMAEETWMNAEEAHERGFVDTVLAAKTPANRHNLARYNYPIGFRASCAGSGGLPA